MNGTLYIITESIAFERGAIFGMALTREDAEKVFNKIKLKHGGYRLCIEEWPIRDGLNCRQVNYDFINKEDSDSDSDSEYNTN